MTRTLLIGAGAFAESHVRAMRSAQGIELVGAVDTDFSRARAFSSRHEIPVWGDVREAKASTGATLASIVTPTRTHAGVALEALGADLHLLVEKPVCLDVEEGKRVREEAALRGKRVDVVSQRRFQPGLQRAKAAVAARLLGKVVGARCESNVWRERDYFESAPWRGSAQMGGGNLLNQGMHALDLLLWFLGEPRDVKAFTRRSRYPGVDVDELMQGIVDFGGPIASIQSSLVSRAGPHLLLKIFGESGTITIADDQVEMLRLPGPDLNEERVTWPTGPLANALTAQYEALSLALAGRGRFEVGLDAGLLAVDTALRLMADAEETA